MHHVNPVREEVCDLAAAKIEIGSPVVELMRVKRPGFRGPEPSLPVQPGRLFGEVRLAQMVAVAMPICSDHGDLADLAAVKILALRLGVVRAAALLQADLKDS